MNPDSTRALSQPDATIVERKLELWMSGATVVAVVLALIPGFPAISAAMIPFTVVSCRGAVVSWRRYREVRRRRVAVTCADLTEFADGELAPGPAQAFRDHLAGCERCQRTLLETMQMEARLTELRRDGLR